MIYLIWAIRAMFCKHEFVYEEFEKTTSTPNKWASTYYGYPAYFEKKHIWVAATCKHCSWHRTYRKVGNA